MCLSPISVINPSKYISLKYKDSYLLQVPCGKCAECQSTLSNQWQYRTYYEFIDCLSKSLDNFILFDTLTYRPKYRPKLTDFFETKYNYDCFNRKHIVDFLKRLRIVIKRDGYDVRLRYFVSSEYGVDPNCSHAPHYHILLFVYGKIDPLYLSSKIADCWIYGRTDGIPYKTNHYVLSHNVIRRSSLSNILRTCNYVTKYVQKSSVFQREIDDRINSFLIDYYMDHEEECDNDKYILRDLRISLKRCCNQFHTQSLHFGESGLSDIDIKDLFNTGVLIMPHFKALKIPVVLPTYYKRKLFYRLVEIDGSKSWQLTDFGREYKQARSAALLKDLENRFKCVCYQYHLSYDYKELANYVHNQRGKIKGQFDSVDILERLKSVDLFNYVSLSDRRHLKHIGLVRDYIGNCHSGYDVTMLPAHIRISDFLCKYVFLDAEKERQLTHIYSLLDKVNKGKQEAFELKQRLSNVYKCFL